MATEEKGRDLADHGNFTCSKKGQDYIFLAKIKTDRFFMDNNSPFLHFLNVN
jgi:hypothetical protein